MASITKALISQDASGDLRDECSSHLDTLMALGNAKSQYYTEKIHAGLLSAGTGSDRTFPITSIQSFLCKTKAYTSDDAKNISNVVNKTITKFVMNESLPAVTEMVSGFVDLLFGATEGVEHEVIRYRAVSELAAVIRLDFAGWSRSVKSKQLKGKCDKVSSFVLYRSVVDMSKVSLNEFISVYQYTVKAENKDLDTAGIVKKCKELYKTHRENPVSKGLPEASISALEEEAFQPSIGHESLDFFRNQIIEL